MVQAVCDHSFSGRSGRPSVPATELKYPQTLVIGPCTVVYSCVLTPRRCVGVANLDDEEWARASFFSAPRVGFFDILFVGGHEAVCAVAVEPPPPFLRSRSRLPHLSDACAHPSAARTRASCVASGRDDRAPHVQGRWVGWVDDAGRASGRLLRCVRRRGPLESHHHRAWPRWPAHGWSPRIHCLCRG